MTTSTTTDPDLAVKAPNAISVTGFFADEQFDFLTRSAIGYAAKSVMDVGEVFATIARITDGDADSRHGGSRRPVPSHLRRWPIGRRDRRRGLHFLGHIFSRLFHHHVRGLSERRL
jgi:hypothetical protein